MRTVLACLVLCLVTGCYSYRVEFPDGAPQGMEPQRATLWSFFWGAMQQNVENPPGCPTQRLTQVTASTNYAYAFLTVFTLGIVAPQELEWRCSPPPPTGL